MFFYISNPTSRSKGGSFIMLGSSHWGVWAAKDCCNKQESGRYGISVLERRTASRNCDSKFTVMAITTMMISSAGLCS